MPPEADTGSEDINSGESDSQHSDSGLDVDPGPEGGGDGHGHISDEELGALVADPVVADDPGAPEPAHAAAAALPDPPLDLDGGVLPPAVVEPIHAVEPPFDLGVHSAEICTSAKTKCFFLARTRSTEAT